METEYINRKTQLVTYLQLHIQSLNEDLSQLSNKMDSLDPASIVTGKQIGRAHV